MEMPEKNALIRRVRIWLALFIVGLVLSGVTAFPLEHETAALNHVFGVAAAAPAWGEPAHGTPPGARKVSRLPTISKAR
jgi:hypothetical protein